MKEQSPEDDKSQNIDTARLPRGEAYKFVCVACGVMLKLQFVPDLGWAQRGKYRCCYNGDKLQDEGSRIDRLMDELRLP